MHLLARRTGSRYRAAGENYRIPDNPFYQPALIVYRMVLKVRYPSECSFSYCARRDRGKTFRPAERSVRAYESVVPRRIRSYSRMHAYVVFTVRACVYANKANNPRDKQFSVCSAQCKCRLIKKRHPARKSTTLDIENDKSSEPERRRKQPCHGRPAGRKESGENAAELLVTVSRRC